MTADYDGLPGIRWSHLKHMERSPLHYLHATRTSWPDTPAMRFGRAVHCAVLEPAEYASRYVTWDGGIRRGKAWDAFVEAHAGADILTADERDRVDAIARAVQAHPVASSLLRGGVSEGTIQWADPLTGMRCKGRYDHVSGRLVDLKTAADAEPRRWQSNAYRYGYHAQLAFYLDGLRASGVEVDGDPAIICVESVEPFDVIVYELDPLVVDQGRRMYQRLLVRLAECLERDDWPGTCAGSMPMQLPAWAEVEGDEHGDISDLGLVAE